MCECEYKEAKDLKEVKEVKEIKLPQERIDTAHVYHLFVIEAENRNGLQRVQ